MRDLPRALRWYLLLVATAGVAATAAALWLGPPASGPRMAGLALTFGLFIALARRFPLVLTPKRKLVLDTAPLFAALLALGASAAMVVGLAGVAFGILWSRKRPLTALFNGGAVALAYGGAGFALGLTGASAVTSVAGWYRIVAAAALALAGNLVLTDVATAMLLGCSPWRGWWRAHRRLLVEELAQFGLAVPPALAAAQRPGAVALLVAPAFFVWYARRDAVRAEESARGTLLALVEMAEAYRPAVWEHTERVARLARALAAKMGRQPEELEAIETAARLHHLEGDSLHLIRPFAAPEPLHPEPPPREVIEGRARSLARLSGDATIAELVRCGWERWDGRGPLGLHEAATPGLARVLTAAHFWDALVTDGVAAEAGVERVKAAAGSVLDPEVARALVVLLSAPVPVVGLPQRYWPAMARIRFAGGMGSR